MDSVLQVQEDDHEVPTLKYLEFVQSAAVHAVSIFSSFYDFAKDNSGPLKPGVQTVEGTVKTVMGPVYEKIHDIPLELLKFADRKVSFRSFCAVQFFYFPPTFEVLNLLGCNNSYVRKS